MSRALGVIGATAFGLLAAAAAVFRVLGPLGQALGRGLAGLWEITWPHIRAALAGFAAYWASRDGRQRWRLVAALVAGLALWWVWASRTAIGHWYDARVAGNRPLLQVQSWHYHLDKIDVDRIAKADADLLVIDHAREGGSTPLTREEVARLKVRADGRKRTVISYISIGEAESYRFFWRDDWKGDEMPGWHVAENCAWPRAHMVRFWHDGWKDIIYRGKRSYLSRILDAGFDGVYLDRVDVYGEQEDERPTARDDMIAFVTEMAATARKAKPGFLVIAQNAEDLLSVRRYRDVIDGLGKEDLLYGMHGTGARNKRSEIASAVKSIKHLQADYKPVFAVEYLPSKELIVSAKAELVGLGMVPTFAHRSLDGFDPLMARANEEKQYGTAEWIATQCKDKRHW